MYLLITIKLIYFDLTALLAYLCDAYTEVERSSALKATQASDLLLFNFVVHEVML